MARVNPHDPNAKFCVSVSRYYTTQIEAESYFLTSKDLPETTVDFYQRDTETNEWGDPTEWSGYLEE